MTYVALLFALLVGHAIADYPLQGDFMSKGKNRKTPIPGIQWWVILTNHAIIHAGFVWWILSIFGVLTIDLHPLQIVQGCFFLAIFEFVAHWIIDDLKCRNQISFMGDQLLHVICKVFYAFALTFPTNIVWFRHFAP
jgi:hypothetical protein